MITLDPDITTPASDRGMTRADDLPFGDPAQEDQRERTISLDEDQDGTLDPHEDGGQAGTEPDQGPSVGPAAGSGEPAE